MYLLLTLFDNVAYIKWCYWYNAWRETIHALNPSNTKYIRSFRAMYILGRFIEYKNIILQVTYWRQLVLQKNKVDIIIKNKITYDIISISYFLKMYYSSKGQASIRLSKRVKTCWIAWTSRLMDLVNDGNMQSLNNI